MNSHYNDLKNNRILIIDDNPEIHDDIRKILGSEDNGQIAMSEAKELLFGDDHLPLDKRRFEIVSAFQGQEGLQKVKEAEEGGRPFAMMFVDVRMPPGWDGVETIKRIWHLYPQLQAVVCTAYSDYSWDEMIHRIGKSHNMVVLKKPFDNIEVLQLAHAMTEKWNLSYEVQSRLKNLDQLVSQRTAELRSANEQLLEAQRVARLGSYSFDVKTGKFATSEVLDELLGIVNPCFTKDVAGWLQIVRPQDRAEVQRYLNDEVLKDKVNFDREYRIVRLNDQQERWVHGLGKIILDEHGQPVQMIGSIQDVTERKQAEEEKEKLEFQNRKLQKSESLGRMAGAIAHHFNNQLQAVMMNLQLAINDLPSDLGSVVNLTEAMQSAQKAAGLSSLMLTYLGQTAVKREPLDVAETCQRHLPMLRAVMPQSVILEVNLASPGPVINANANQIQQILTNLFTNACEAMGEIRGVIRLTLKTVSTADFPTINRFPIDSQPQGAAYACLEVADGGCGIADEDIEKVFDPFFSTKFIGRGLGLPVVLGIARTHGGCVTMESKPGKGSAFRVFLPLLAEAIPLKSAPMEQAQQMAVGATVLVVDDEPFLRKAVTLVLKRSGFTVFEAVDGVEAVEVFQKYRDEIGCVICDLTMPRMNGWETLKALRKIEPDIPLILASGYSEEQVMAGDHSELPQAFLSKPYELASLKNAIARVIRDPKVSK